MKPEPAPEPYRLRVSAFSYLRALLIAALLLAPSSLLLAQAASQQLIPFQGRLTNQQGVAYTSGQYSITFNLYTQAVGGSTLWTERHEKVGVSNGMVNVFLGSITPMSSVDFSTVKYLGITIDVDNNPATADPEMVPRQMIIPAFSAKQAERTRTMDVLVNGIPVAGQSYGWSAIIDNGNPFSGFINGSKIADNSLTTAKIADSAVTLPKLAPRPTGTVVGTGGVGISNAVGSGSFTLPSAVADVTNLTVTITTTGRPVFIGIRGGNWRGTSRTNNSELVFDLVFTRNGSQVFTNHVEVRNLNTTTVRPQILYPLGSYWTIDTPPAGTHVYKLRGSNPDTNNDISIEGAATLVAFEL